MNENLLNINRRSSNQHLKHPRLRNPSIQISIIVPHRVLIQRQQRIPRLARLQEHLIESLQLLLGPRQARLLVVDVRLHDLGAVDGPAVRHGHADGDLVALGEDVVAECGRAIGEGSVGEAVAEGEERADPEALVVPVADV